MAGKTAMPLLLGAGAIALVAMGGKKKKKKTSEYQPPAADDLPSYVPPPVTPKPTPQKPTRPPGATFRGDSYDGDFWGSTGDERLKKIREFFKKFGYAVEVGPWPMNKLGPKCEDGKVELKNQDGTTGCLGGGDDQPSAVVRQFQKDYNAVSFSKIFVSNMGGLDPDGLVGPYTLNGLRYVNENLQGKLWPDVIQEASLKGYKA